MSQESNLVKKLKTLIEERQQTILANKKNMRNNLKEYKKNLELDRKLKAECRTLQETIYRILRKSPLPEEKKSTKNIAVNRDSDIITPDEEQDS